MWPIKTETIFDQIKSQSETTEHFFLFSFSLTISVVMYIVSLLLFPSFQFLQIHLKTFSLCTNPTIKQFLGQNTCDSGFNKQLRLSASTSIIKHVKNKLELITFYPINTWYCSALTIYKIFSFIRDEYLLKKIIHIKISNELWVILYLFSLSLRIGRWPAEETTYRQTAMTPYTV